MLRPDAAQKQIARWQADSENPFVKDVATTPKNLRPIGFGLLERDDKGDLIEGLNWQEKQTKKQKAVASLDRLSVKDRRLLFRIFFGDLAPHVESTWQFLKTTPYQLGYVRKAFRAPADAELTFSGRISWLTNMIQLCSCLKTDAFSPQWFAAWAVHLQHIHWGCEDTIGKLLAAVIDGDGPVADEVFTILRQSALGEHEIGGMGRHVSRALLLSARPEGWELMEKMLLAAQRQEGLRQTILETIDETHPQAFRRMLALIRDHKLARFSSVVRAVDVWFGMNWESTQVKAVNHAVTLTLEYLDNQTARNKALAGGSPEEIYLALWSLAFNDVRQSLPEAHRLLDDKRTEVRFATVLHLNLIGLKLSRPLLLKALDDADLRIAWQALTGGGLYAHDEIEDQPDDDLFERLQRLFERTPQKPQKLKPLIWPWTECKVDREIVAGQLVAFLGKRPPTLLIPYLPALKSWNRRSAVELLSRQKKWDSLTRETLIGLAGDSSQDVRCAAYESLQGKELKPGEILQIEGYLKRKANDLRNGVIGLLLKQTDADALAGADRLLSAGVINQRLAGLELLRQLASEERSEQTCRRLATDYQENRKKLSKEETTQITAILETSQQRVTLDNALGLMDPDDRTPVVAPTKRKVKFVTPAAIACIKALDELVHEHRETAIKFENYSGETEELLGNVQWGFPHPDWRKSKKENAAAWPLRKVWETWHDKRPKSQRDADGLEMRRASIFLNYCEEWNWQRIKEWSKGSQERKALVAELTGGNEAQNLRYGDIVHSLVGWFLYLYPPEDADFLLDAAETAFSLVPESDHKKLIHDPKKQKNREYWDYRDDDWRNAQMFEGWMGNLESEAGKLDSSLTEKQIGRLWRLLHWRDQPIEGATRDRPSFGVVLAGHRQGEATQADLLDDLLGPRPNDHGYGMTRFESLARLTNRKLSKEDEQLLAKHPGVRDLLDRCRERILEIELARGEAATAATAPAWSLNSLWGIETLQRILTALGGQRFKTSTWRTETLESKPATFTHLVSVTYPRPADGHEEFSRRMKALVKDGVVAQQRILELAFLAPQWSGFVEHYLNWPGFSEGLYWFLAHMRYVWGVTEQAAIGAGLDEPDEPEEEVDDELKEKQRTGWERLIAERTALSEADRQDGVVDVGWFRRTYELLTPKRWQALADAARFSANAAQAKRAQFIADVLTGKAKRKELIDGVKNKKLKESVRLLGLFPLAGGAKRDADLAQRYKVLQEYRRYAKTLSSMTRPQAFRAIEIGMHNLANTAGYPDPLRLEWALEADQVKDLAKGSITVKKGDVTVTLSLDDQSRPSISTERNGKSLKSIPPAVRKDKKVAELQERSKELRRQASRMKQSLETAMCRGDAISGAELVQLCGHAVLAPLLQKLIFIGDRGSGYPGKGGKALRDCRGKTISVNKNDSLRIAHASDLFESGQWDDWQHECFKSGRVQPFKQVFRELYVVTRQEKKDGAVSHRYAGQQVNERQAFALWGQRGWHTQDGVWKVFHDEEFTVSVSFRYGYGTPLEVEGLTIDGIQFHHRDDYKPLKLAKAPPRIFSEVMRDLDLVVSVAHAGGVDPEASASTVEMREALLRETCEHLGLHNVRLKKQHALIDGELGNYSVHLGSATVHRMPGGAVCIVPVHAQHRGRLFLPFADDDPGTAEVISKVILLAQDAKIQDPTILEQLRRR